MDDHRTDVDAAPAPDALLPQDVHGWALLAGLAVVAALTAVDIGLGDNRIVLATVVIAPFLTALFGSVRATLVVAVVTVAVTVLSGTWNGNFGDADYFIVLGVVALGSAFAWLSARSRLRLAADRRRFQLLSAAASISDVATTIDDTVQRLSDLLVPSLADVCVIDVVHDDRVDRLAVAASGPRAREIEQRLRARATAPRPEGAGVAAMRSGRAHLILDADEHADRVAVDDEDRRFLRSLEGRSAIVVPLRARGRAIGSMALATIGRSGRRFDRDDFAFAQVLSGRVALALDNAGLFSELETLEAQLSAALGGLAEAVTVQNDRGELVYANAAAAAALGFSTVDELVATPPSRILDVFDSYYEDGTPLRVEDLPGRKVLLGQPAEPLIVRVVNRRTGEERWRVTKATAVLDRDGRPRLAVNVIEDVTDVKRNEIAQRFLAEAGALLSSSLDIEETLQQVARLAVPELADWCGVTMPDEQGFLRSVAVAHVDPGKVAFARDFNARYPTRVTDEGGAAAVLRDGASQVVNEIPPELLDQAVPDPEQRAALEMIGMRAVMIVPMVAAAGAIGTISFVSAESGRTFSAADLALAQELGRRAGTAVENARLYTERSRIARTLQASLLPDALPDVPGFALASLYRPAGEENFVGGDFYDAFEAGEGWMVVIGDVTGRGAEAAALTAQARYTLRTAGRLLGDPVGAVEELNRALAGRVELSIVTVAAVLLEEHADGGATATIVSGGHPPPILVRGGDVQRLEAPGPMVGAWRDATWTSRRLVLQPGDVLVLYTDGVTDACGDDERFGESRLAATLHGVRGAPDAVEAVRAALERFERGAQADDTAVIAIQRLPAAVGAVAPADAAGAAPGYDGGGASATSASTSSPASIAKAMWPPASRGHSSMGRSHASSRSLPSGSER